MTDVENKIKKFQYTVVNNFDDVDLGNFYDNLSNLEVIKSTDEIYGKLNYYTNSYYYLEKNMIIIKKNKINDESLYHELFHMASSAMMNSKDVRSGFYLNQNNRNIGLGINEGYTEYLTRKYFGQQDNLYTYEFEITIAKAIEDIIGKHNMESFYLRAQLGSLIDELSLFCDNEDIMLFFKNVDFVYYYICCDKVEDDEVLEKVKNVNEFIINLRLMKYGLSYLENYSLLKVNYEDDALEKYNEIQNDIFINNIIDNYIENNKLKKV